MWVVLISLTLFIYSYLLFKLKKIKIHYQHTQVTKFVYDKAHFKYCHP